MWFLQVIVNLHYRLLYSFAYSSYFTSSLLSKLPHSGIPEHHLCRIILILGYNSYLARAKGTVLLHVDQLKIDIQIKDNVAGDDGYQVDLTYA
ncbi:MAG TPA: hypothetical protein VEL31_21730 [Ktedonobacteraceae bacterium]|nr:hypothetical protein [Ktedonobacteraceae bacterium]